MSVRSELNLPELLGRSKRTGVYAIMNRINGRMYIGSTGMGFSDRWSDHWIKLSKRRHTNIHLQRAFIKSGPDAFEFVVLEDSPPDKCIACEQKWMDFFHPEYNITKYADASRGYKHTDEAKEKIGAAFRGKKLTEEHRLKLTGRIRTEQHRRNLSASLMGNKSWMGRWKNSPKIVRD